MSAPNLLDHPLLQAAMEKFGVHCFPAHETESLEYLGPDGKKVEETIVTLHRYALAKGESQAWVFWDALKNRWYGWVDHCGPGAGTKFHGNDAVNIIAAFAQAVQQAEEGK